jgi:HSP20 family protein
MPNDHKRRGELLLSVARAFQQTHWQPPVDAFRTARGWVLKFELAGVLPQDIELAVSGRTVVVRGVRRDVWIEERQQSHCMEISYNRFQRTVALPCDLEAMSVASDYRDGMLVVRLTCEGGGA